MADPPLTVELGPGHVAIVAQWKLVLTAVEQMCALHDVAVARATLSLRDAVFIFAIPGLPDKRVPHAMTWELVDSAPMPSEWSRPLGQTIMNLRRSELLR
jgi:hypothetical protein